MIDVYVALPQFHLSSKYKCFAKHIYLFNSSSWLKRRLWAPTNSFAWGWSEGDEGWWYWCGFTHQLFFKAAPFQCWANKQACSWIFFLSLFFGKFQETLGISVLSLWKKLIRVFIWWCGFHLWESYITAGKQISCDSLLLRHSNNFHHWKCSHHSGGTFKGTGKTQRSEEKAMYSPCRNQREWN